MNPNEARSAVAETYRKASIHNAVGIAKLAGYRPEDFANLPTAMVGASFGCGNPLAYASVREGDTVVDLGSGAGIDVILAAKRVGPCGRVIGVDMTRAMVERGRANVESAGLSDRVDIRQGIIESLPVESGSVDWVISNCVLSLSPEKARVFAEIARVLKPGGRMLISDIVVQGFPPWLLSLARSSFSGVASIASENDLLEHAKKAGLVNVNVVDRLVYEPAQVEGLLDDVRSSLGEAQSAVVRHATSAAARVPARTREALLRHALQYAHGKVWSAKISAERPDSATVRALG